jgi:3-oxoacyl-[acyl-carrier-protein] synthase-3
MEMFSRVVGTGRALPGQPVSNAALVERLAKSGIESSDEWIRERTGISQRYIAAEGVTSSDLAAQAAQEALSAAGLSAAQLEMIIVATSTPDMIFPSTACLVQKKIGASGGPALINKSAVAMA